MVVVHPPVMIGSGANPPDSSHVMAKPPLASIHRTPIDKNPGQPGYLGRNWQTEDTSGIALSLLGKFRRTKKRVEWNPATDGDSSGSRNASRISDGCTY